MDVERQSEAAVATIRMAMADSKAQLEAVNGILVGFTAGLDKLEGEMMPIYNLTEKLRETQKNIDISVHELRAVNDNFTTATDVAAVLQQGAKYDQERYIKTMHKLLRAIEFLEQHRGYEGAGKALDAARHVLAQAQAKCKADLVNDAALLLRYTVDAGAVTAIPPRDADVAKAAQLLTCLLSTKCPPGPLLAEYGDRRLKAMNDALEKAKASALLSALASPPHSSGADGSQGRIAAYLDNMVYAIHAEKELSGGIFPNEDLAHAALSAAVAPLLEGLTADVKEEHTKDVLEAMELHYLFTTKCAAFRDVLQPPLRLREHPGTETTEPWRLVGILGKIQEGLATGARGLLAAVKADLGAPDKLGLKDGNVHPVASHTMHFLRQLGDHIGALECLLETDGHSNAAYFVDAVMLKLLEALQAKAAAAKARADLKALFVANNTVYVATQLGQLARDFDGPAPGVAAAMRQTMQPKVAALGESAVAAFVQQSYDVFDAIVADPTGPLLTKSNSAVLTLESGRLLKDKFARFNAAFQEMHTHHKGFAVSDVDLRRQLMTAATQRIAPAYTAFYDKYAAVPFSKKHMDKYVVYTPDAVRTMLGELFQA
ncbi:hypothetical protein ACHHYP_09228 [Achlya hypogyna]|uniref:Exocyst subunit Exo70 family protein n=1 Tax=Achlya hypogyna TaxID=1202772 RepID=A0A1V9YNI8_ACHHY|nr:hypothetical protein ACHHYP_09228 [Achlya hypogyna]